MLLTVRVSAGIFQNSVEFPWSGYKELSRGLACDFSVSFHLFHFFHIVSYTHEPKHWTVLCDSFDTIEPLLISFLPL